MAAQPTDRTPLFSAWLASWPEVRRELAAVLDAYERRHPTYDPGWVEPVFAMMTPRSTTWPIVHNGSKRSLIAMSRRIF